MLLIAFQIYIFPAWTNFLWICNRIYKSFHIFNMLQSYWIHKMIWIFYSIFRNIFLHCRVTAFNDNYFYLSVVIVHLADKGLIFWGQQAKYYPLMDVNAAVSQIWPVSTSWHLGLHFWLLAWDENDFSVSRHFLRDQRLNPIATAWKQQDKWTPHIRGCQINKLVWMSAFQGIFN